MGSHHVIMKQEILSENAWTHQDEEQWSTTRNLKKSGVGRGSGGGGGRKRRKKKAKEA